MTARDVMREWLDRTDFGASLDCDPSRGADAILAALAGAGFAVVPLGGGLDALGYLRWTVTACRRCGYEQQDCHCTTGFAAPMAAAQPAREGGE